jgi:predicted PurR-regulated permease PerM
VAALVYLTALSLLPLWLPLLLAAWFADLAGPLNRKLARWLHGRAHAAALVAASLLVLVLSPLAIVSLTLASDATKLAKRVMESTSVQSAVRSFVSNGREWPDSLQVLTADPKRIVDWVRQSGGSAFNFASSVAGTAMSIVIGLVVFVTAFYVFLVRGDELGRWLERNAPVTQNQFRRLSQAFFETGRGLIVGVGLTALLQGAICAVGYLIVGVPHAFVLALLTAVAALIPSLGSGLVWLPLSAILAIQGDISDAIVVVAVGSLAGLADNFVRPALSRFGRLNMPVFLLFCSMLGGMVAFGPSGLIVGPLFVRMTLTALRLWRERNTPVVVSAS